MGEMGPQNIKYPLSARVFLFDLFLFVCLFVCLFCFFNLRLFCQGL